MIKPRFGLQNVCKGRFVNTGSPRVDGFATLANRFQAFDFLYPLDPNPPDGAAVVATSGSKSPYSVIPWLQRVGLYPLDGNLDADGVPGYSWRSVKGWAQPGRLVRVPQTLLIVTYTAIAGADEILDPFTGLPGTDFLNAMNAAVSQVNDLGVDVILAYGPPRFCIPAPATAASETLLYTDNFFPLILEFNDRYNLELTYTPPTNLNGGDVYVVIVGDGPSGFLVTESGAAEQEMIGYYEISESNWFNISPPATPATPPGGVLVSTDQSVGAIQTEQFDMYAMTPIAASDSNALAAVGTRCRNFRVDVTCGRELPSPFPFDPAGFETVIQADARFRGSLPGEAFMYDQTNATDLVTQIINRALAFFA